MWAVGWTEEFRRDALLRDTRAFTIWDVLTWFVIPLVLSLLASFRLMVLFDGSNEQQVRDDLRQYRVGLESGVIADDVVWDERVLNGSLSEKYRFTDRSSAVLDPWGRPYRLGIYDAYTLYGWGEDVTNLGVGRSAVSREEQDSKDSKDLKDLKSEVSGVLSSAKEYKSDVLMVVSSSGKLEDDERDNYSMALYVISGEVYACTSGYAKNRNVKLPKIAGLHLGSGGCGDKLIRDKK